ncbi:unnamed protein product [Mytilus coruscus]|uniref:Uncharacterized protein n=1 Tax=Mytilus coruscus TaxID=42192 RepID=A0A6J8CSQ1_MYTCO|nr:unnamed protein product [Mytilus coruscus]
MSQMEIEWENMGKQGYMSGPVRVRLFLDGIFHLTYDAIGVTLRIYDESSGSIKLNITVKEEYFEDMDMFVDVPGKHEGTNESFSFSPFTEDTVTMNTMSPTVVDAQGKSEGTNKSLSFSPFTEDTVTRNSMSPTAVDVQGKREGTNESLSFSPFTEANVPRNKMSPTAGYINMI